MKKTQVELDIVIGPDQRVHECHLDPVHIYLCNREGDMRPIPP